jgi:DNA invertase Pin-like site-specific DNA recombinase
MRVALYVRVSTANGQTTENQIRELRAWARKAGHQVVQVYEDAGISGAKGRDKRPQFDAMLKDAIRREFDILAVWSVDRLGRSLQDLIGCLDELHAAGVDLYLHKQAMDTTTPAGKALFGMLGVFAEFERALIRERVCAGLARAREKGTKSGRPIGRPQAPNKAKALRLLGEGLGVREVARRTGLSPATVSRLR